MTMTQKEIAYTLKELQDFANMYQQNLDRPKVGGGITLVLAKFFDIDVFIREYRFSVLLEVALSVFLIG